MAEAAVVNNRLLIPKGTRPLMHQVAGHVFGRKNKIGFLQSDDGFILKPVQASGKGDQDSGKGERELQFYLSIYKIDCLETAMLQLQKFLPAFYGTWTTPEYPGQLFMKLENLTKQFKSPCTMDVKIGPITYDCNASPDKVAREKAKFAAIDDVGFKLEGVTTLSTGLSRCVTLDRMFLRSLNKDTVLTEGIAAFFAPCASSRPVVIDAFLRRLRRIESWFSTQNSYQFFASSLFLVYDAEAIASNVNEIDKHIDVRMIDFAHVFTSTTLDTNYLTGLRSLISYIVRLMPSADDLELR